VVSESKEGIVRGIRGLVTVKLNELINTTKEITDDTLPTPAVNAPQGIALS
jgi:hypothetical protein